MTRLLMAVPRLVLAVAGWISDLTSCEPDRSEAAVLAWMEWQLSQMPDEKRTP